MSDPRLRNFSCFVYPDSAPVHWHAILDNFHIPYFISPLHDRDNWSVLDELNNKDHVAGTPKKAHWHVMLMFNGKQSIDRVAEYVKAFGGVMLESVSDLRGMARYFCHLDNPDKAQYSPYDVVSGAGADYMPFVLQDNDELLLIRDILRECFDHNRLCWSEVQKYYMEKDLLLFRIIKKNHFYIKGVLSSEYESRSAAAAAAAEASLEVK